MVEGDGDMLPNPGHESHILTASGKRGLAFRVAEIGVKQTIGDGKISARSINTVPSEQENLSVSPIGLDPHLHGQFVARPDVERSGRRDGNARVRPGEVKSLSDA